MRSEWKERGGLRAALFLAGLTKLLGCDGVVACLVHLSTLRRKISWLSSHLRINCFTIGFKGRHFPEDVMSFAAFFYLRQPAFHQDFEEITQERGVDADHALLNGTVAILRRNPLIHQTGSVKIEQKYSPIGVQSQMER